VVLTSSTWGCPVSAQRAAFEEVYANGAPIYMNKASGTGEWLMIGTTDGDRALTIVMNYDSVRRCIRAFAGWESTPSETVRRDRSSQ